MDEIRIDDIEEIREEDIIRKLKSKFKMSDEFIYKLLYTNGIKDTYDLNIATVLAFIDDIDEDERVCSIIDLLHDNLGFSLETLASIGGVNLEELEEYLRKPKSLNDKKKYQLAIRIMLMHFIFKEKYNLDIENN